MRIYLAAVGHQRAVRRLLHEQNPATMLFSYYDLAGLSVPFRKEMYEQMIKDGFLKKRRIG